MMRAEISFVIAFVLSLSVGAQKRMDAGFARNNDCGRDAKEFTADPGYRAVRLIKDPSTRQGWLVEQSIEHPAWPARLIQLEEVAVFRPGIRGGELARKRCDLQKPAEEVRAGQTLIVVADTRVLHSEMEAVALSSGARGDSIMVRTRFGGKLMQATVTSKTRATITANGNGDRP